MGLALSPNGGSRAGNLRRRLLLLLLLLLRRLRLQRRLHRPYALGHSVRLAHYLGGLRAQLCAIRCRLSHALLLAS